MSHFIKIGGKWNTVIPSRFFARIRKIGSCIINCLGQCVDLSKKVFCKQKIKYRKIILYSLYAIVFPDIASLSMKQRQVTFLVNIFWLRVKSFFVKIYSLVGDV